MCKQTKVLYIDDQAFEINGIKEELEEAGLDVTHFTWPLDAECLKEDQVIYALPALDDYEVLIIDIIMGSGDLDYAETRHGYLTGVVLHRERIAPNFGDKKVVFVSALPDGGERATAKKYATACGIPYIQKSDTASEEIIEAIKALIGETGSGGAKERGEGR